MLHKIKTGRCKIITAILLIVTFALLSAFTVQADETTDNIPYQSYSFWDGYSAKKPVADKAVYEPAFAIDGYRLNLDEFSDIQDITLGEDGLLYMLDSAKARIIVLNKDYKLVRTIDTFMIDGAETELNLPQGIFIEENGNFLLSDTENGRVLYCDANGTVLKEIRCPESDIIPDDLDFYPIKIVKDKKGFAYLLTRGSYYGAMVFDSEDKFVGFYGSNLVKTSLVSAVKHGFQRMFTSNKKLENSVQRLPYQFADICVNSTDFVYTVSANTQTRTGQVRKLSPGGSNILNRSINFVFENTDSYNFGEPDVYKMPSGKKSDQNFSGIVVDENDNTYALDAAYGKIYIYDKTGKSVSVFGGGMGTGKQLGVFETPVSIERVGTDILVSDSTKHSVTVFRLTDYGKLILKANNLTVNGDYEESEALWKEAYKISRNSQLTYRGLTKASMAKEDYDSAFKYAKAGLDQENYSIVFEQKMNLFLENNLWWMFLLGLLAIAGIVISVTVFKRRTVGVVKQSEVKLLLKTPISPMDVFYQVKYKGRGSAVIAAAMILLLFITKVLSRFLGGFMYVIPDVRGTNSLLMLVETIGIALMWTIISWLVTSLIGGNGTLKEIFIVTGYSLIPLVVYNLIFILFSQFVIPSTVSYLDAINVICWIYTAVIMTCGMIRIHDFDLKNVIKTALITALGIILALFIIFVVYTLLQSTIGFIVNIYSEVTLR